MYLQVVSKVELLILIKKAHNITSGIGSFFFKKGGNFYYVPTTILSNYEVM